MPEGNACRYKPSIGASQSVLVSVEPDFLKFGEAVGQYRAEPRLIHGAQGFYAHGTLYLTCHARFVKIHPLGGRSDAEEIAAKVIGRL